MNQEELDKLKKLIKEAQEIHENMNEGIFQKTDIHLFTTDIILSLSKIVGRKNLARKNEKNIIS